MLARLQQAITFTLLALAIGWGVWAWSAGHPVWGAAGALLIVSGYALVLALEFELLRRTHGDDPTPRATLAELLRAWWGEVLAAPAVFCWHQPFRSQRWPDHLPADAHGRRGLVLLHGYVCNRGIWNPWLQKLHQQRTPFVALNLEPVFGSIADAIAGVEAAVRRIEQATGLAPVIVAHSMGGLALRRWWAEHGDDTRVHHAVTIATPHRGTWLARFATSPNARQLQPGSPWLRALAHREPIGRAQKFTCFYGHCDNIVFPPTSATLQNADNRHLPGVAHVHMAARSEPWGEVVRWLDPP